MEETFSVRDLTFSYPGSTSCALSDLSLTVPRGSFFVLCGVSGCGKSTLLRHLKPGMEPGGARTGEILFRGKPFSALTQKEKSASIGFVRQNAENQIVTDKVWHELAFGLESLGLDHAAVRRRTAEMAGFFGMESWYYHDTASLSGGQKQLLSLASVMAMQPEVLLLDEPTAQLDPIAAADFFATLGKINRELGTTILLSEHRLEDVFPYADRAAVMDGGKIVCEGTVREVCSSLAEQHHPMLAAMPAAVRVWAGAAERTGTCPVSVGEGRGWLAAYAKTHPLLPLPARPERDETGKPVLCAENVWFRYSADAPDILKNFSLTLRKGGFYALLGGNGAGKSTALGVLSRVRKPQRGNVISDGRIGLLPQDPQTVFAGNTVREDLCEAFLPYSLSEEEKDARFSAVVRLCRLGTLLDRHPYDLSGGEQQRAALGKLLLSDPEVLLLDEPTKGFDAAYKAQFAEIIGQLTEQGKAVLMVSHDVEFCAQYAHRCALFFDGAVINDGEARAFFAGNHFYTTAANRIAREHVSEAVTAEELTAVCGGTAEPLSVIPELPDAEPSAYRREKAGDEETLPWWKKLLAGVCALVFLSAVIFAVANTDLTALTSFDTAQLTPALWAAYGAVFLSLAGFAVSVRSRHTRTETRPSWVREKPGKKTVLACILIFALIPVTIFLGMRFFGARRYFFTLLLVLIECMLPFFVLFEGRRPQAREVVLLSVLCAIGTAGRAVFFMLPQFKPVIALTILAGTAFGAESGFLVGAFTMLVSNILFAQGPWTPWQMFAMGLIGLLSGLLFRRRPKKLTLCVFGAFASIVLYGGIMNPAAALIWSGEELSLSVLVTYWLTGFPVDCVQAAATVLFLWLGADPMLDRLTRIRERYLVTKNGTKETKKSEGKKTV